LSACLQHVDSLLAHPAKLETESNFYFNRAALDSHGDMRRIELRRMLWTLAQQLGSTDLTWEDIEAQAVVGTVDPQVPIVSQSEFFHCVLKTLHLVAAELRVKLVVLEEALGMNLAMPLPSSTLPIVDSQIKQPSDGDASVVFCPTGECTAEENISKDNEHDDFCPASVPSTTPAMSAVFSPAAPPSQVPLFHPAAAPARKALFSPAPGVSGDELAPINGMIAMVLNNDGSFDPQRLFVGSGVLSLSDPRDAAPSIRERFFGTAGASRLSFNLSQLVSVSKGEAIGRTPVVAWLPNYGARTKESLERMVVFSFAEGNVMCIWFSSDADCELCSEAVIREAYSAREFVEKEKSNYGSLGAWAGRLLGINRPESEERPEPGDHPELESR